MTPEDDVNNEEKNDSGEQPLENETSAEKPADDAAAADSAEESASASTEDSTESDIDLAAKAQSDTEEAIAKAMAGAEAQTDDDDPLGFGDQRMDADETKPDVEVGDEVAVLKNQLKESEARLANHADQLLRMQAEMENQRKRAQNDVTKAHKFALEKFALDLLPVKDSLEMGLQAATAEDAEPSKIVEGSELTLKMLAQALEKYNIVEVNPVDEKFDPEFHQAMSMQPVEGKEPNTVASVMQKGYTLNDRLIRPALVMVAK